MKGEWVKLNRLFYVIYKSPFYHWFLHFPKKLLTYYISNFYVLGFNNVMIYASILKLFFAFLQNNHQIKVNTTPIFAAEILQEVISRNIAKCTVE